MNGERKSMEARIEEGTTSTFSSAPVEKTPLIATTQPTNLAPPKLIMSLHMPRMLGAIHIVMFHFAPFGRTGFAEMGNVWVTFFFMLSAFGTAHSTVGASGLRNIAESGPWFLAPSKMLRRVMSVYPTYLVAFVLSVSIRCYGGASVAVNDTCILPPQLVIEGSMLAGWFPWKEANSPVNQYWYNVPSWFINTLAALWFFEAAVVRLAAASCVRAGKGNVPWSAIVYNLIWLLCSPLAGFPFTWQSTDPIHHPPTWLTQIPVFQSVQMYFCGALVACWLHSRADAGLPPFRFAASISSVLLIGYACLDLRWFSNEKSAFSFFRYLKGNGDVFALGPTTNAFVPVFAALIAGLAGGADPVAVAFNWLPAWLNNAARDLSTGVYLLQSPIEEILLQVSKGGQYRFPAGAWPVLSFIDGPASLAYFFALLGILFVAAFIVHHGVQQPIATLVLDQLMKRATSPVAEKEKMSKRDFERSE